MLTPDVIQAQTFDNYDLAVTFADGEKRRLSMAPYLEYPAFSPLKDIGLFMRARVAHGTVIWTDEIDISPDTLYLAEKETD